MNNVNINTGEKVGHTWFRHPFWTRPGGATLPYPPGRRWLPSQCRGCPIWSHPPLEPSLRPLLSTFRCNHPATPAAAAADAAADAVDDGVVVAAAMNDADEDTLAVVIAAAAAASAAAVVMTAWWLLMHLMLLQLWLHLVPNGRPTLPLLMSAGLCW